VRTYIDIEEMVIATIEIERGARGFWGNTI
jgi:hypothetical protein